MEKQWSEGWGGMHDRWPPGIWPENDDGIGGSDEIGTERGP